MINLNELRYGNLVQDAAGNIIRVTSIHADGINLSEQEIETEDGDIMVLQPDYRLEEIYQIPLTPEILVKCGFEEGPKRSLKNGAPFWVKHFTPFGQFIQCSLFVDYNATARIDCWVKLGVYLHQLQNLYFALNGEELEIKDITST